MLIPDNLPPLTGHSELQKQVLAAYAASRFPHAWIFRGPAGIGKFNFAVHLAYNLFQNQLQFPFEINQATSLFKRMKSGGHGDLIILVRLQDDKGKLAREITADQVRAIQGQLAQTAYEGGWRVVIVDGVEHLNRFGANALLKILEEPPQKTVFFLITSSLGRLLPTIRSRAQVLNFSALPDADIRQVIAQLNLMLNPQDLEVLLSLAQGSPGRLQNLFNLGGIEFCQEMVKAFAHLKTGSLKEVLAFAYAHADNPEIFEVIEDTIRQEVALAVITTAQQNHASSHVSDQLKIWDETTLLLQTARKADLDKKTTLSSVIGGMNR